VLAGADPALAAAGARLLARLETGLRDRGRDDGTWTYDLDPVVALGSRCGPPLRIINSIMNSYRSGNVSGARYASRKT
jgi:hypothetical protein